MNSSVAGEFAVEIVWSYVDEIIIKYNCECSTFMGKTVHFGGIP